MLECSGACKLDKTHVRINAIFMHSYTPNGNLRMHEKYACCVSYVPCFLFSGAPVRPPRLTSRDRPQPSPCRPPSPSCRHFYLQIEDEDEGDDGAEGVIREWWDGMGWMKLFASRWGYI